MKEQADSSHVSGGYLVARPVAREGTFWDASLVPATLWTASDCLASVAPDTWALEWVHMEEAERLTEAEDFDLPRDRVPELISWATSRFDQDFGWPNVFLTLAAAREFCARFVPGDSDAAILGLALAREDADDFLQRCTPGEREGAPGVYQCLMRRQEPEAGGQLLGSEVLGFDHGSFHSSLCNALERDFAAKFGARPNAQGLYDDHSLARQCAAHVDRGEVGAEPCVWRAWALTRYAR
ncbi:hypothetical protein [Hyalangium sp.]|uniref:hypothetical protein n=1 Tax=Hyalangium sp. TaxID=2028555 RepID=UPI002D411629|nr:hypothetical protein [Hyalangium sp.]HYI00341.1 hypothetical protein [Hyalangium sp.]